MVGVLRAVAVGREGARAVVDVPRAGTLAVARLQRRAPHHALDRSVERVHRDQRLAVGSGAPEAVHPHLAVERKGRDGVRPGGRGGGIGIDRRPVDRGARGARDDERGRVGVRGRVARGGHLLRRERGLPGERAVEALARIVGIHRAREPRIPRARVGRVVPVRVRRVPEDLVDRLVGGEQRPDVVRVIPDVAVGDDRLGARLEERGGVVVDPLLGDGQGRVGIAGLTVPRRVAQVHQEHDRIGGGGERPDRGLAVVLVVVVAVAGGGVEAEAVLRRVVRVVGVPGWANRCRGPCTRRSRRR